jgi:hypothetical protein
MSDSHYLFGYGSLINSYSRSQTGFSEQPLAVTVDGWRREWNIRAAGSCCTVVGMIRADTCCNGVLVRVPAAQLACFDERETGYQRIPITSRQLRFLRTGTGIKGPVWGYQPKRIRHACGHYPVVQSYLDVILAGCLEFGDAFARQFLRTTHHWHHAWLNDRPAPRYCRAQRQLPLARIDRLLADEWDLSLRCEDFWADPHAADRPLTDIQQGEDDDE